MHEQKLAGVFTLVAAALQRTFARPRLLLEMFLGYVLVYSLYEGAALLFGDLSTVSTVETLFGLGLGVLYLVASFVLVFAAQYVVLQPERISLVTAIMQMGSLWWPLLAVVVLFYLITITGFIFLIIPAILFGLYSTFCMIVVITEQRRGLDVFTRSADLVEGAFWRVVARLLVFGFSMLILLFPLLVMVGVSIAVVEEFAAAYEPIVGIILLSLYGAIAVVLGLQFYVVLYESLLARKPADAFESHRYSVLRTLYLVAAIITLPLLLLAGGVGSYFAYQQAQLVVYCEDTQNERDAQYDEKCDPYWYPEESYDDYRSDDWLASDDWYDDDYSYDDDWYESPYIGDNGYDYYNGFPTEIGVRSQASLKTASAGEFVTFTFDLTNTDDVVHKLTIVEVSRYLNALLEPITLTPTPVDLDAPYDSYYYYQYYGTELMPGETFTFTLSGVLKEDMSEIVADTLESSYVGFCVFDDYTCTYEDVFVPESI